MRFNRALFLDLDGTIIRTKSGSDFPKDENDWEFIEGILPKIKFYSNEGFLVCIVTNQGGIELGHTTHEAITRKLTTIGEEIEQYINAAVSTIYCPDMEGYHRKPNPGMAYQLALQLTLDLDESIMVGDSRTDEDFAANAHIGTYMYVTDFTKNYR